MTRPKFLDLQPVTFRDHIAVVFCAPLVFMLTALTLAYWLVAWAFRAAWRSRSYIGAMLVLGMVAFSAFSLATAHRESYTARAAYNMEFGRLYMVDNAQAFAKRSLGLAEMEAMRASDLDEQIMCLREELSQAESGLRALSAYIQECEAVIDDAGLTRPVPTQAITPGPVLDVPAPPMFEVGK